MPAITGSPKTETASRASNDKFVAMLPDIEKQARFAFRGLPPEAREEFVHEVVAVAFHMFARLFRRGRTAVAYPTPLAQYAIGRVRAGRRLGSRRNRRDLTSPCARSAHRIVIEPIDRFVRRTGQWREALIEDRRSTPAETAAARLDFASWLGTLTTRDRRLAETLAAGETTGSVARIFRISAGRVSQLRRDLRDNWYEFVGELVEASGPSVATA